MLLGKALAEVARVGGAVITLFTILWLIGRPAATEFVTNVVDAKRYAPIVQVEELRAQIKDMQADQKDFSKIIEHQGAQIDSIEKLATEQRSLSTQILLELRKQ
jgi:uncharacterized protein YdcH (DUF465 family)